MKLNVEIKGAIAELAIELNGKELATHLETAITDKIQNLEVIEVGKKQYFYNHFPMRGQRISRIIDLKPVTWNQKLKGQEVTSPW